VGYFVSFVDANFGMCNFVTQIWVQSTLVDHVGYRLIRLLQCMLNTGSFYFIHLSFNNITDKTSCYVRNNQSKNSQCKYCNHCTFSW